MRSRSSLSERFFFIINSTMVFVYAGVGLLFLSGGTKYFQGKTSLIFGSVIFAYSIYRGYSLFKKYKTAANEDHQ